jgi:hypothetical protein
MRWVRAALLAAAVGCTGAAAQAEADLLLVAASRTETLELSLDELEALPQRTVETQTEFTDGTVAFTGPLARDVLAKLGLDGVATVRFIAANDYFVDIPTQDFIDYDVILAMEADGKTLSRRDRGPLWLIYPISGHDELKDPLYLRRLIWQVVRIEAL